MGDQRPRRRSSKGRRRPEARHAAAASRVDTRAAQRAATEKAARRRQLYTTLGAAAAVAVVVAVALIVSNMFSGGDDAADAPIVVPTAAIPGAGSPAANASPDASPTQFASPTAAAAQPSTSPSATTASSTAAWRTRGDPNAPVTVIEWADYQCPFCGEFAREMEPRLIEEYVDSGRVYYEYRDFAFLGQESLDAASAAGCAADQGKSWEYHATLFANQRGENEGAFARARLTEMARQLGLDGKRFETCLESDMHMHEVQAMLDDGRAAGVRVTPTFFINGTKIEGVADYDELRDLIEDALAGN